MMSASPATHPQLHRPMNAPSDRSPWIIDADARNFEQDVVGRSIDMPVVVDFWAEWCEPCKALGPILEKAAREGNGRFLLAKVDVDRNPELAQVFRVQSIPMVIGLVGGRLVDAFQGAQPPAEVEAFLQRVAPGGPLAANDAAAQAEALVAEEDLDGAVTLLQGHLAETPTDTRARLTLAGFLVDADHRTAEAKLVLAGLSEEEAATDEARALQSRLALVEQAGDVAELRAKVEAAPEDPTARLHHGRALVAHQRYEAGLEELLEVIRLDPDVTGKKAKKTMLETFAVLGVENPIANDFRFKLSLLLFS